MICKCQMSVISFHTQMQSECTAIESFVWHFYHLTPSIKNYISGCLHVIAFELRCGKFAFYNDYTALQLDIAAFSQAEPQHT